MIRNQAQELPSARTEEDTKKALLRYVEHNVVGKDAHFQGPFGSRQGKHRNVIVNVKCNVKSLLCIV